MLNENIRNMRIALGISQDELAESSFLLAFFSFIKYNFCVLFKLCNISGRKNGRIYYSSQSTAQ